MQKINTTLEHVYNDIQEFYDPRAWHFLTLNGIDAGEKGVILQWIFSQYGQKDMILIFELTCSYESRVPSMVTLIPSAFLSEREVVDMFGLHVEGATPGLYLDKDSKPSPLRRDP